GGGRGVSGGLGWRRCVSRRGCVCRGRGWRRCVSRRWGVRWRRGRRIRRRGGGALRRTRRGVCGKRGPGGNREGEDQDGDLEDGQEPPWGLRCADHNARESTTERLRQLGHENLWIT